MAWDSFQFSTTTTTTPPPAPLPLQEVMQDLMNRMDVSEALLRQEHLMFNNNFLKRRKIRFGHLDEGLSARNAFGEPIETTPSPKSAFR